MQLDPREDIRFLGFRITLLGEHRHGATTWFETESSGALAEMERPVDASSSTSRLCSPPAAMEPINPSHRDAVLLHDPRRNPQTGTIIANIEEILLANLDALRETRVLAIPIRSRRTGRVQLVRFPSSKDTEAKKFSRFIEIYRQAFYLFSSLTCCSCSLTLSSCPPSNPSFIPRGTRSRHSCHEKVRYFHVCSVAKLTNATAGLYTTRTRNFLVASNM